MPTTVSQFCLSIPPNSLSKATTELLRAWIVFSPNRLRNSSFLHRFRAGQSSISELREQLRMITGLFLLAYSRRKMSAVIFAAHRWSMLHFEDAIDAREEFDAGAQLDQPPVSLPSLDQPPVSHSSGGLPVRLSLSTIHASEAPQTRSGIACHSSGHSRIRIRCIL